MADLGLGANVHHAGSGTAGAIAAFTGAGVYVPPCIVDKIEVTLGTASSSGDVTYTMSVNAWSDMSTIILDAFGGNPNSTGFVTANELDGQYSPDVSPRGVELTSGGAINVTVGAAGTGAEDIHVRVFYRPLA